MKIPKADGTTNLKSDRKDAWQDILCDICGKSCLDSCGNNFEYAQLESHWGYGSNKDGEYHEAQVCEPCYDSLKLKPTIKNYLF